MNSCPKTPAARLADGGMGLRAADHGGQTGSARAQPALSGPSRTEPSRAGEENETFPQPAPHRRDTPRICARLTTRGQPMPQVAVAAEDTRVPRVAAEPSESAPTQSARRRARSGQVCGRGARTRDPRIMRTSGLSAVLSRGEACAGMSVVPGILVCEAALGLDSPLLREAITAVDTCDGR